MNTHRASKVILCYRPHTLPDTENGYYGEVYLVERIHRSKEIPHRFVFVCIGGVGVCAESRIALGIPDLF